MRGSNMCDGARAPVRAFSSCLPQCIPLSDIIQSISRMMHHWLRVSISRPEQLPGPRRKDSVFIIQMPLTYSPRVHKHTHVYIEPFADRRIPTHGQLWT
jgi:hypothetical protein